MTKFKFGNWKFLLLLLIQVEFVNANDNLVTCLSGKYHSLCDYSVLSEGDRVRAIEARQRENFKTCSSGKYSTLCDKTLLTKEQLNETLAAEKKVNYETCSSGQYKSLCKHSLLTKEQMIKVQEAERQVNLKTCLNGNYPTLCDRSLLTAAQGLTVIQNEKAAALLKSQNRTNSSTNNTQKYAGSINTYVIEHAHDDVLFIINEEKFEAKTFCSLWNEGDEVIFLEGSAFGACATAVIYNKNRKESCDVWCE